MTAGCDINNPSARISGVTALTAAVATRNVSIVADVLDYGADPHDPEAIYEASKQEWSILDLILKRHADRYRKGRKGWGAEILETAIDDGDYHTFQELLGRGADASLMRYRQGERHGLYGYHSQDWENVTAFGLAINQSRRIGLKFVEKILQLQTKTAGSPESIVSRIRIVEFHSSEDIPLTAFIAAIGTGYQPIVALFLRYNAGVNYPAKIGIRRTPLQRAAEVGNLEIIELLLHHGADVNAPPALRGGGTALQLAAIQGFFPIVRTLLESGADVDAPASKIHGRTALEGAAEHGRLDMVSELLQAGAGHGGRDRGQFERAIALAEGNDFLYIADMLKRFLEDGKISYASAPLEEFLNLDHDPSEEQLLVESMTIV